LTVADSFDAMTNNRPYRSAMDISAAVEEVKRNSDLQFDASVVAGFLQLFP
jgi:HD-GYP domain-containing protein (c-di-GMP phosphodiesterase class II)